jgi:hypothetical protein
MKRLSLLIFSVIFAIVTTSCYSFSGASIPPDVKTFAVDFFPNRATMVNPTLSSDFTDGLRAYISSRSSLRPTEDIPDIEISGEITEYSLTPMAAQTDAQAALQRLKITIKVNFANNVPAHANDSFSESFSIFRDFDSSLDFSSEEAGLVKEIIDEMVDKIFMKAFGNW